MESNKSNFWLGLSIGSVVGAILYRYSRTPEGKQLKDKMYTSLNKLTDHAGNMMHAAKEKAMDTGTKVADKVAYASNSMAEKANEFKAKVHSADTDVRK